MTVQKDKLRELAVVLTEKVSANASIDCSIKESVKSKLKVLIKRTLRKYGYPPDMQKLATETVLKQAEKIADELTRNKTNSNYFIISLDIRLTMSNQLITLIKKGKIFNILKTNRF